MGDEVKPEGTGKAMQSYIKYLPEFLQTTAANVPGYQQQMLEAKQVIAPQELAFEQALLGGFGPGYAQQSLDLARMADPEYYALREQAAGKMGELVGGLDPNKLSGSELAEVERGLNRLNYNTGNYEVPSSTTNIANALTFGDRLTQKKKDVAGIMSTVPPFLGSAKSGLDIFQQVTGRPGFTANTGNQFGAIPVGLGQNFLNEIGQNVRQNIDLTAKKRDWIDRVNESFSAIGSIV